MKNKVEESAISAIFAPGAWFFAGQFYLKYRSDYDIMTRGIASGSNCGVYRLRFQSE